MGEKLLRGKLAISVFVECEQRFRRGLEFPGGELAILVGVERGDQGRRRALSGRWASCRSIFPFGSRRWRRTQFFAGDLAIAVLVERGKGGGCAFDLLRGDGAVTVLVKGNEDQRRRWRAVAIFFRWLLRDRGAGQQGEGEMQGCGFHDFNSVGLVGHLSRQP
ncbi:MAG: hypothetical protein RLZZ214_2416 [Verrucomicrobiota bacterium]